MSNAVHRVIEEQASKRPESLAVLDGPCRLTYRELNVRANALARVLAQDGLTRGSLALVRMPRGIDLAVVLLAVLKAGACYAWIEPGSPEDIELPASFCIVRGGSGERYSAIDVEHAVAECAARPSPNLPILTRGSDVACVLPDHSGHPHVLVPHATIAALPQTTAPRVVTWQNAAGAFDLWLGLMSGVTLSVGTPLPKTAAA